MLDLLTADWKKSGVQPPALKSRPEVGSHLLPFLNAYNSLRCHRTRSEAGYNPISYNDLILYAQTHGFFDTPDTFHSFETLIQACDHAFLSFADEKQRQAISQMKSKSQSTS